MPKNNETEEFNASPEESTALDLMESNLFDGYDVTSLPEMEDGTYPFQLTTVEAYMLPNYEDEDERYIKKASLVFKWSISDEESPLYGEQVQGRYIIYPVLKMEELTPQKRTEVYRSVRRLKNFLNKLGYNLQAGMSPKYLGEHLTGTVAMIEVYHNYSEKTDTTYRNIRSVEVMTRDSSYEPDF